MLRYEFDANVWAAFQITHSRRNIDAKSAVSKLFMRQRRRYFAIVAIYSLPFSKKTSLCIHCFFYIFNWSWAQFIIHTRLPMC